MTPAPDGSRTRMLDAALATCHRKRCEATTVDDLCAAIGRSKAGFFHHVDHAPGDENAARPVPRRRWHDGACPSSTREEERTMNTADFASPNVQTGFHGGWRKAADPLEALAQSLAGRFARTTR